MESTGGEDRRHQGCNRLLPACSPYFIRILIPCKPCIGFFLLLRLMNDFTGRIRRDEMKPPEGFSRTLTVALDTAQYQIDMNTMAKHKSEDPYSTFNLVMR